MQPFLKRANVLSLMERKFYLVKFHVLYANIWFLHSKNLKLSEARTIQQCEQKEHSVCSHSCVDRCTSGWERVSDCLPPLHHLVVSVCGRAWIFTESWGLIVDPHGCVVWVFLTDHYSSLYTCFCWRYFFLCWTEGQMCGHVYSRGHCYTHNRLVHPGVQQRRWLDSWKALWQGFFPVEGAFFSPQFAWSLKFEVQRNRANTPCVPAKIHRAGLPSTWVPSSTSKSRLASPLCTTEKPLIMSFVRVYACSRVCACVGAHGQVQMCPGACEHGCGDQRGIVIVFLRCSPPVFWDGISHWTWSDKLG